MNIVDGVIILKYCVLMLNLSFYKNSMFSLLIAKKVFSFKCWFLGVAFFKFELCFKLYNYLTNAYNHFEKIVF